MYMFSSEQIQLHIYYLKIRKENINDKETQCYMQQCLKNYVFKSG